MAKVTKLNEEEMKEQEGDGEVKTETVDEKDDKNDEKEMEIEGEATNKVVS